MRADTPDNICSHLTFVESFDSFRSNILENSSIGRVFQKVPCGMRISVFIIIVRTCNRIPSQVFIGSEDAVKTGADMKAFPGQGNRRYKKIFPREGTVVFMEGFQYSDGSGNSDSLTATHRITKWKCFTLLIRGEISVSIHRSGLHAVEGENLAILPASNICPATYTAGLRLCQSQDPLYCDRCICSRSPGMYDLITSIRSKWIGSRYGKLFCCPSWFFTVSGGNFRLRRDLVTLCKIYFLAAGGDGK